MTPTPPAAYAAALASLPGLGPRRLLALLQRWGEPERAWMALVTGSATSDPALADACRPDDPAVLGRMWQRKATPALLEQAWRACWRAGLGVHFLSAPDYPTVLAKDHQRPAVLFSRGSLDALEGPRVAIVGTRRCTGYGRDVAHSLGADLAAAGVRVVSGLAIGIDGAAHEGALAAGGAAPVGVVGSGLDIVYPRRHSQLWHHVAERGLLLTEAPPGAAAEPWRFPARNRIMAAIAQVVVVVESHLRGGSRHTVEAALDRGVTVMAVPGSVRSPASAGTNELLATGMAPARDATDVLVALGLSNPGRPRAAEARANPPGEAAHVLEVVGWEPVSTDQIVLSTGLAPLAVSLALAQLERDGWVARRYGWWERVP